MIALNPRSHLNLMDLPKIDDLPEREQISKMASTAPPAPAGAPAAAAADGAGAKGPGAKGPGAAGGPGGAGGGPGAGGPGAGGPGGGGGFDPRQSPSVSLVQAIRTAMERLAKTKSLASTNVCVNELLRSIPMATATSKSLRSSRR